MSTTHSRKCAATRKSCGTPSGWRKGGRCPACRAAHNAETNQYRGLKKAEREQVLAMLRHGRSPQEAADGIGKSARSLSAAAVQDAELRAALDGLPIQRQAVARWGEYLAALAYCGGNRTEASKRAGIALGSVLGKVQHDQDFAAAERSVLAWITSSDATYPRIKVTDAMLDKAAAALEEGAGITAAAELAGLFPPTLRLHARRNPRLQAALPAKGAYTRTKRRGGLDGPTEDKFRELWADSTLTLSVIAKRLGVSTSTVSNWRRDLDLPIRPRGRRNPTQAPQDPAATTT